MEDNNTMAVVLSFVLCWYVYQDAGMDIKGWISCDGWISSSALHRPAILTEQVYSCAEERRPPLRYRDAAGGSNLLV